MTHFGLYLFLLVFFICNDNFSQSITINDAENYIMIYSERNHQQSKDSAIHFVETVSTLEKIKVVDYSNIYNDSKISQFMLEADEEFLYTNIVINLNKMTKIIANSFFNHERNYSISDQGNVLQLLDCKLNIDSDCKILKHNSQHLVLETKPLGESVFFAPSNINKNEKL